MIANILSIAGSDPSGGAGIQADLKAISANGGYAMAAITGLTVQNTRGVFGVELISPDFIVKQIEAIFDDIRVDAVKIGMLGSAEIICAVASTLQSKAIPIVLDPVMVAKGGNRLLASQAVSALREKLLPLATIITPNLPEAADLLGEEPATSRDCMMQQAQRLLSLGSDAVFLKGGHLEGAQSPDLLLTRDQSIWLEAERHATPNTHGTGCTLSAALATKLGQGLSVEEACASAKHYTRRAILAADGLTVGTRFGPTDHFFALRQDLK